MMVRATLILLVLLNLGYFSWQVLLSKEEDNKTERGWSGIAPASIPLLEEAVGSGLAIEYDEKNRPGQAADLEICTKIGAFSTRESAQVVRHRLMALSIRSSLEKETVSEANDYLVYLPSQGSWEEASRLVRVLRAKSIDSFVMTGKGNLENAISLGLFSRRSLAEELMRRRIKDGYDARIRENKHTEVDYYWVALNGNNSGLLGETLWMGLKARYPSLQQVNKLCDESIASHSQLP